LSPKQSQAVGISTPRARSCTFFRDHDGVEVDLVIERADGTVLAVEVKSSSGANHSDSKGLRFLRDALGDRFHCGVVLHTGPITVHLDDRIWATPISALWGGGGIVPGATGLGSDRS
jgi:predicted AAA+ superfamily ATPase